MLTDQHKYLGISVTINRKPTNDFPILVSTNICSICHRLAEILMLYYGSNSVPYLGGIKIDVQSLMLTSISLMLPMHSPVRLAYTRKDNRAPFNYNTQRTRRIGICRPYPAAPKEVIHRLQRPHFVQAFLSMGKTKSKLRPPG